MSNVVMFANNKGGVGKTSMSTVVAGRAAQRGLRTLIVDLDKQMNNAPGRFGLDDNDEGKSLYIAVAGETTPAPVEGIRPNLDMIPGGRYMDDLADDIANKWVGKQGPAGLTILRRVLQPHIDSYDLVVLDAPLNTTMTKAALVASDWLVIPTKSGSNSLVGLNTVAELFTEVRDQGLTDVQLAGAAIMFMTANATRFRADIREYLTQSLGEAAPVYETIVRFSEQAGTGPEDTGLMPWEYAERAASAEPWYKMRNKEVEQRLASPAAAKKLTEEWERLADEVLASIDALAAPAAQGSGDEGEMLAEVAG